MPICLEKRVGELEAEVLELNEFVAQLTLEKVDLNVKNAELESANARLAAENAELESEKTKAEAARDTLRNYYQQSLETIKRLERGLLGKKSEKLPNDSQLTMEILTLVMAGQAREPGDSDSAETKQEETKEDDSDSATNRRKKGRPTGRKRKPKDLPRLEIEILPLEVQHEGLDAFERIGEESSEVTERRQGGTLVVVYKKPKFKRKKDRRATRRGDGAAYRGHTREVARVANSAKASGASIGGMVERAVEGMEINNREDREGPSAPTSTSAEEQPHMIGGQSPDPSEAEGTEIFVAPPPDLPIERGSAGPGLLAETIVRRWLDAMPVTRMVKMFAREGVPIAKSTICGWHESLGELVRPLVDAMHQDALKQPVLCTDATGVPVQAKGGCVNGHFFVLIAPLLHILFFYTRRHDSASVDAIIGGFRGNLVADAHSVYDHLYTSDEIIEVGCWSHARRYFHKSLNTDPERAKFALGRIAALFKIEGEIAKKSPPERLGARRRRSRPIVEEFFEWCKREALVVLDETPIQAALRYALNQSEPLQRFLEDERLPLHNNWSETQLRREAIGRKNWTFLGTHEAGHTNARFMSLLASAELHGLEPYAYIRDLLCLLPSWPASRVLELAPAYWNQTLEQTDAQQRLDANVFRAISMGVDPIPAGHSD